MKYAALCLIIMISGQGLLAADKTETFYFTAPENDQVQPPPTIPEPAFAEPSKVDALAVHVDELSQKVQVLEKKLEACGCSK